MNWTVQQKIRAGFWLLAFVPVILGTLAARNAHDLVESSKHVDRTHQISQRLEKLFSRIKDVEVAVREFILVGGDDPIAYMTKTHAEIEKELRELRGLRNKWDEYKNAEKEEGKLDPWMANLEMLVPQKFQEIERIIDTRNTSGRDAASQQLLANQGSQAIDDIQTSIQNMLDEEHRRLQNRTDMQSSQIFATLYLFFVVLLVNLALLGMLYLLQRRENRRAKEVNEELERRVASRTEALQRSNEDLQQFAYVASHDLKEPLRMISSYTTLLQRRYAGRLDPDADTFIGFIVDGVDRMHMLIQDILEYARAGADKDENLSEVNVEDVLRTVVANLKVTVAESGASVTWENLPQSVPYDPMRLAQIFQNLIGNAIKYRGDRRPEVHVASTTKGEEVVFAVKDNGIGIDPEYHDKIFGIFQRLHGKEYEGTGIGLAMVKRIVERYGGRIWVESTPGAGSTFYFTVQLSAPLPARVAFSTSTS